MIRVGVVAYHNTIPLAWNLEQHLDAVVVRETPSVLSQQMSRGELDLGIVPVAAVAHHPHWTIAPGLCIASRGEVGSVRLLSRGPLDQAERLHLDPASRTSNLLARLYLREVRGMSLAVRDTQASIQERLGRGSATVSIGDEALFFDGAVEEDIDLGKAWHTWTGLPFVYAVWAGPAARDPEVQAGLMACWRANRQQLPELVQQAVPERSHHERVRRYVEEHIRYTLGEEEERGMELFLNKAREAGWLPAAQKAVGHG